MSETSANGEGEPHSFTRVVSNQILTRQSVLVQDNLNTGVYIA